MLLASETFYIYFALEVSVLLGAGFLEVAGFCTGVSAAISFMLVIRPAMF